jgi:hypothetical protein
MFFMDAPKKVCSSLFFSFTLSSRHVFLVVIGIYLTAPAEEKKEHAKESKMINL